MRVKLRAHWRPLMLWSVVLLGLLLRLYGVNWDQGNSFHPDERQILFHVTTLGWPNSWSQALDADRSPLNPHFFAYGSFPLYLLALVGHLLGLFYHPFVDGSLASLTLVGRVLSALFDSGTILLTAGLALLLVKDEMPGKPSAWRVAFLAAILVAFTPLQLQLSHFYAVDTMLLFFVMLTLFAGVAIVETDRPWRWSLIAGVSYGLALGTKFSAAPLAIPLLVAALLFWYRQRNLLKAAQVLGVAALSCIVTFLLVQPYAVLDRQNFVQQVAEQGNLVRGMLDYPYVRQFAGTIPYVYEFQNMVFWGLGVTLGLTAGAALVWFFWRLWRREVSSWLIVLSWVFIYTAITGSFYVKFMRYMLPIYPLLTLLAATALISFAQWTWKDRPGRTTWVSGTRTVTLLSRGAIALVLAGTLFQGCALLNVYSQPNTRIQASRWLYQHVKRGSVLTYEQWDDPLPVPVDGYDPSMYVQGSSLDANGQPATGLDLYGDDTVAKAQQLAHFLPTVNAITMPTDRLDKSIPRLPGRYPLTIRYYQLLFSGQLGFHLVAQFENYPHLFGITLNDGGADESYSVFDHPTARIFVRNTPYPYTPSQLFHKLSDGLQLPPPGATLAGGQHSLLLSQQELADDQQGPSFAEQFPTTGLTASSPVFLWWLTLVLLGIVAYPLAFLAFRGLADRGYIFSKTLGLLLLSYVAWILAATHIVAFSRLSLALVCGILIVGGVLAWYWQRHAMRLFLSSSWKKILWGEGLFTVAYLLFVLVRSYNPDLWHPSFGGEKPMELAFLNAVLRSRSMPPLDPWFAGGYINYYYYGYVIIASLIKLTGIIPTVAFNLAIPTLFALTFTGAVCIVYSLTESRFIALLGGYYTALIGNLNGLVQLKGQLAAVVAHGAVPPFDYWQSSRIIPFTINEFPFWSFLFADLHPHVIALPIAVCMLGVLATFLLRGRGEETAGAREKIAQKAAFYLVAAFIWGTIACVNPWDMPVYAVLLALVLVVQRLLQKRDETRRELLIALAFRAVLGGVLFGLGYLFYLPFYVGYQQLYVNGLGIVKQGTSSADFLTIFGLWTFLALSFFLTELSFQGRTSRFKGVFVRGDGRFPFGWERVGSVVGVVLLLLVLTDLGVKALLGAILVLGIGLFVRSLVDQFRERQRDHDKRLALLSPIQGAKTYTFLLLIVGISICLGIELVYIRDFLDGGDYERMNTVFKFSLQAWLCLAIGGALAVHAVWRSLRGVARQVWGSLLIALMLGCSIFPVLGTQARLRDHQNWIEAQKPAYTAAYTPSLDGFAFVRAWYPGDAGAITWLNAHVAGAPVILEAGAPASYQWFNRVSVFTGLPDVLGWPDHVSEQRYAQQALRRASDIGTIYTTQDAAQALALLRTYHVRYIYVGDVERQEYAGSPAGLQKFDALLDGALRVVYRSAGVTIYQVL